MNIPEFKTTAGQSYSKGSIGQGDLRLRIQNSMIQECRAYALALEAQGFTCVSAREISAGDGYGGGVNLYYEYVKDGVAVYVFWDNSLHTAFVTAEPMRSVKKALAPMDKATYVPSFTQLAIRAGMCYIAQFADGSFLIVDGGVYYQEDEEKLFAYVKENTRFGKPKIAMWLFSHPHSDHICLATHFLERYQKEIEVEAFAYQFPDCDKVMVTMENSEVIKKDIQALERVITSCYPSALRYALHTGQEYVFQGATLEILWTIDNTYPTEYTSVNDFSVAARLRFENGETVMLLSDCMQLACRAIAHIYGNYLKSDYLQVTHHGLIGGDVGLYKLINPAVCFWSKNEATFNGEGNSAYKWCLGEGGCEYNAYLRDGCVRERTHYHMSKTVTVTFGKNGLL